MNPGDMHCNKCARNRIWGLDLLSISISNSCYILYVCHSMGLPFLQLAFVDIGLSRILVSMGLV